MNFKFFSLDDSSLCCVSIREKCKKCIDEPKQEEKEECEWKGTTKKKFNKRINVFMY